MGDNVNVTASNFVTVGEFLGDVTADGRTTGLFGLSIEQYNIIRNLPHGSLMCRVGSVTDWELCGTRREFTAQAAGCLEFEINDNDKTDNSGVFSVTVSVN